MQCPMGLLRPPSCRSPPGSCSVTVRRWGNTATPRRCRMSIVAISETAGSLGNEIGRRLAERLNYRFADREIIGKAAERFGENVSDLRHAAEEKPSLWDRWTDTQSRYKTYIEAIILEMATGDDVVLAGLASAIVLRPVTHALRVRTHSPERRA